MFRGSIARFSLQPDSIVIDIIEHLIDALIGYRIREQIVFYPMKSRIESSGDNPIIVFASFNKVVAHPFVMKGMLASRPGC